MYLGALIFGGLPPCRTIRIVAHPIDFGFVSEDRPRDTLYHYTSLDALVSIVQSKRMRASNIRFLNDRSESKWLKEHVVKLLQRREREPERMSKIVAAPESSPKESHFVASFTELSDDLSQWRAYCPPGLGVSIGFSTKCLRLPWIANRRGDGGSLRMTTALQPVRYYSPKEHEHLLSNFVERLLTAKIEMTGGPQRSFLVRLNNPNLTFIWIANEPGTESLAEENAAIGAVPSWLRLLSSVIKHSAFDAEKEWRVLVSDNSPSPPGQAFRQGKSTLIPYIEIRLDLMPDGKERNSHDPYFIDEVVVGPTPDPELTVDAIKNLFASEGHPEVPVNESHIPFKTW